MSGCSKRKQFKTAHASFVTDEKQTECNELIYVIKIYTHK